MKTKTLLLSMLCLFCSTYTYSFRMGGIYYYILSDTEKTVEVTNNWGTYYSGKVIVK